MAEKKPVMRVVASSSDSSVIVCQTVRFQRIGSDFGNDRRTEFAEAATTHDDQVVHTKRDAIARAEAAGLPLEREGEVWQRLPD